MMATEQFRDRQEQWLKHVLGGAPGESASRLHEYAIGLIYDALGQALKRGGVVRVATVEGMSKNLLDGGVAHVRLDRPVPTGRGGGAVVYEPDIVLEDADGKVVRVVEVWRSSAKNEDYRSKMASADIDVVETKQLKSAQDLTALLSPSEEPPRYSRQLDCCNSLRHDGWDTAKQPFYDSEVEKLIRSILYCRPSLRRQLKHILEYLDSIESLAPLSRDNPKRQALGLPPEDESPNSLDRQHMDDDAGNHLRHRMAFRRLPNMDVGKDLHEGRRYDCL